ncbi:class I SAM-dependent methyltransferase [Archaeoglobus profundus]|uniref:Methyltransferase type 11 n=1 Tax=Archaeoglobus profundus (strain DSM 5631 / JCM 9629 / NBRC 100127 / Av18) TaxID=572546 RepID=D2RGQ6_ARCPA|nr:rRNA adenine N-6-methyltransferase family protein [Archaeoglobus profundus]ADB57481.1 Methyltransferase type 11 [Archaeoglobus profundus DSM 5631]
MLSDILESDWRRKVLPVKPLLEKIEKLESRNVAFDIGAGTGYFTVHLAKFFRKVYAVEKDIEAVKKLANKGLRNVGIIVSDKPPEIDFEVDFVLFADSLHEIENREEYADWVKKHAKSFAVIDWKKESCLDIGPPSDRRLDIDYVLKLFKGFNIEVLNVYKCHYFIFGYVLR